MNTQRLPYPEAYLNPKDALIVRKRGGGERRISPGKWWINKGTPVGEPAELWEEMPHQGRRPIEFMNVIAVERKEN